MAICTNKLLRVDLSTGRCAVEDIPAETRRDWIGGRGLGIKYLYDELKPGIDPLGPENKLVLTTGPMAGTAGHGFARWIAMTKSPLTGGIMRAVGGGSFGAFLKFAGIDMVIVEGQSDKPVYLYVEKDRAELRPADQLWGMTTADTEAALKKELGGAIGVASIGPAGENLVKHAIIISSRRSASRGGVGTVMGSKKLKAIAVRAVGSPEAAQPDVFRQLTKEQIDALKESPRRKKLNDHGTIFMVETALQMGWFPVKNFREGSMPGLEKLFASEYFQIKTNNGGCYGCMTRCGQVHVVKEGRWAGVTNEGPEYESIWAFSGQVGAADIGFTIFADGLCDDLGIDTITMGSALGWACELFERGILSPAEVDGLDLTWGNIDAFIELINKTATRTGFGDILADGTRLGGQRIGRGAEKYSMHTKGMEMAAYEPRAVKGYALSFGTSNIGGSHMYGRPKHELYGGPPRPVNRFDDTGRGDLIALVQLQQAGDETGIVCNFGNSGLTTDLYGKLLVAGTGFEEFGDENYRDLVGERIICLERAFNIREGFGRKDDYPPERMLTEPLLNAGPSTGQVVREYDTHLDEFYEALGYTREGVPSQDRINKLGLGWLANDLAQKW